MVNYTNMRNLAERLIKANGRDFTLIKRDEANAVDPAQPWRESTEVSEVTITVKGVFVEFANEDFDGSLIRRGDKMVLLSAISVEKKTTTTDIETYDYITDGGPRWKILKVESISPGPVDVYYELQVRH